MLANSEDHVSYAHMTCAMLQTVQQLGLNFIPQLHGDMSSQSLATGGSTFPASHKRGPRYGSHFRGTSGLHGLIQQTLTDDAVGAVPRQYPKKKTENNIPSVAERRLPSLYPGARSPSKHLVDLNP